MMVGPALLVRPVTTPGASTVDVLLPRNARWYDHLSGVEIDKSLKISGQDQMYRIPVNADSIPAYYRGGYIVTRRERPRRSTVTQETDPYTLVIALDASQSARGELYVDDGRSYAFRRGLYMHR